MDMVTEMLQVAYRVKPAGRQDCITRIVKLPWLEIPSIVKQPSAFVAEPNDIVVDRSISLGVSRESFPYQVTDAADTFDTVLVLQACGNTYIALQIRRKVYLVGFPHWLYEVSCSH